MKNPIIKFRIKSYYFSLHLLPSLAFISLFFLLIYLGLWQIHRAVEKRKLQTQFLAQQQANPILLNKLSTLRAQQLYLPVLAEGHFDNKHNYLLDNKIYQHQIGYEVLTPFILKNNPHTILINRGWIPQGQNREKLPAITSVTKNIMLEGLAVLPQKTFSFKTIAEKKWPQRLQALTPEFLHQKHLQPFIIILTKPGPYSFMPLWQPVSLPASRHYAYAFQWFGLSLTLLIAFFISQLTRYDSP
jgi:surfeit locus 1 family protein